MNKNILGLYRNKQLADRKFYKGTSIMTLLEIGAGVFMSAIMLAVLILIVKLIRDTRATMKKQSDQKDWFLAKTEVAITHLTGR